MIPPPQERPPGHDQLVSRRVAILGLGLMGGSLALALHGRCAQLLGYDPNPQVIYEAQTRQVVDYASMQIDEILPQADLVILAAPVKQILQLLSEIDLMHVGPAVILDIGSTKRQVMAAMQALPDRFDPLGGHPICGKESSSLSNADPALYQGAPFVLCRLARTSDLAVLLITQLLQIIGAHPLWMQAADHDRWIAATSHLPYLVAHALVHSTPLEAAALIGPGYRSSTRLAASFAPMLLDILETNRELILPVLELFRQAIDQLEIDLKTQDWPGLEAYLEASSLRFTKMLAYQSNDLKSEGQPG